MSRGEVRLCSLPAPDKRRPVLLLTRPSSLAFLNSVTVAPITTSVRSVASEVLLGVEDGMKTTCAVNLHNVITVPKDALGPCVARLSLECMQRVCAALSYALGCEETVTPP